LRLLPAAIETAAEQQLPNKINAFRSDKEVIKAQYSAAEAQVRIYEAATGVGDDMADIGLAMQRVLDHTETTKARAAAIEGLPATSRFQDLSVPGPAEADVDRQLEQLGIQSTVDDELAKLKKELAPESESAETAARDTTPISSSRRQGRNRPTGDD
jgi:phage shock protein A